METNEQGVNHMTETPETKTNTKIMDRTAHQKNRKKITWLRGITLVELFTTVGLISMLLVFGVPGLKSFFNRMEITNGIRTVTAALSTARYHSFLSNKPVKFSIKGKRIVLQCKSLSSTWEMLKDYEFDQKVTVSTNANPVFYPLGSVSPLCSIFIENSNYKYKVTVSINGEIRTFNIRSQ